MQNKTRRTADYTEPGRLEQIDQRGVLNVCSYYNTTDYYVYKGIPKGFHYELVKDFADYLGVKLNIEVNTNIDESIQNSMKANMT